MLVYVRTEDLKGEGVRDTALNEAGFTTRIQASLASLAACVIGL